MHHEGEGEFLRFMEAQELSFNGEGATLRLWSRT